MTDLANAILQAAAAENVNLCSGVIYWTPSNLARHRWSEAPAIRKSSRGPKPFSPQFEPTRPFRPNLVRRGAGSRARNCQARRRSNDCTTNTIIFNWVKLRFRLLVMRAQRLTNVFVYGVSGGTRALSN